MNVLLLVSFVILALSVFAAACAYGYEFYLKGVREARTAELTAAQQAVNIDTVEEYIRLKNRLNSVETLLDQHVELSEFFSMLESKTLASVRFSSLSIAVGDDRTGEIEIQGTARSFNALAAQSTQLASEKRLKRAIFSDIVLNANGTVGFSLSAIVDPRLITSADVLPGISEPESAALPEAPAAETQAPAANIAPAVTVPPARSTTTATTTPAL